MPYPWVCPRLRATPPQEHAQVLNKGPPAAPLCAPQTLFLQPSRLSQMTMQPSCVFASSASLCSTSRVCQMGPTKAVGVHCHPLKRIVSCARQLRQDIQAEAMQPAPTLLDLRLACKHRVGSMSHCVESGLCTLQGAEVNNPTAQVWVNTASTNMKE